MVQEETSLDKLTRTVVRWRTSTQLQHQQRSTHTPRNPSTDAQLPIGFQLMANHWEEATLLRVAGALEQATGSGLRRRPAPQGSFYDVGLATPAGQHPADE